MAERTPANEEHELIVRLTTNGAHNDYFWFFGHVAKLPYGRTVDGEIRFLQRPVTFP